MYAIFPHAEYTSNGPEETGRGYVVRTLETLGVPYTRMTPVRTYKSLSAANKACDKLNGL